MMPVRRFLSVAVLGLLGACGTVRDWREVKSAPMSLGDCYQGLAFIAQNSGFAADEAACDRGLGIWQSRWKMRQLGLGRPGRYRLRAEVLLDEGSAQKGWPVRFHVEQQKVKELRHSLDPREEDWSGDGQHREMEELFGDKLARRLTATL
jgi:hypothetical protein